MTTQTTTIHLEWDKGGHIRHRITGHTLPPPRNDRRLWVLAPSASFLLAHQFGSMKPSHGLITCSLIFDMLFDDKYVLTPINSALRGAKIDFIYTGGPSIKLQFHPQHGAFANSDSVEEGVRQLINNYTHYVYSQFDELLRIMIKTSASTAIGMYYRFIEQQIQAQTIGKEKDNWSFSFSVMAAQLVAALSKLFAVPENIPENDKWAKAQTDFLAEQRINLEKQRKNLFTVMGLS